MGNALVYDHALEAAVCAYVAALRQLKAAPCHQLALDEAQREVNSAARRVANLVIIQAVESLP